MRDNKQGGNKGRGGGGGGKNNGRKSKGFMEINGKVLDFRSIFKEVEQLGSADMTWKERKDLENKKVVSLGGKAPKIQRLPLSVARLQMKNQKIREHKMLQQDFLLGHSGEAIVTTTRNSKQQAEKRKLEDSVLKTSEGRFRNGVLDVKHLLKPEPAPRKEQRGPPPSSKGKKKNKKGSKNNRGKRKGGGRKRH